MGKYSTGANGAFSGKVGSMIGSNWRNVDYLRGLAKRKKKGSSELQLAQQMKFALCANQLRVIKDVLNIGFSDKKLNKITGYNAAVRLFLNEAVTGSYPSYGIDYSKIKMSKGSLLPLPKVTITMEEDIKLTWLNEPNALSCFPDDKVFVIIYNQNVKNYRLFDQALRQDEEISFALGGDPGDVLHIWTFCIKRDASAVSDSAYIGTVTLPQPS